MAHTQGKKHQSNLARRAATEAKEAAVQLAPEKPKVDIKKFVKIGRPGYRVTKQLNPATKQQSLLFQIDYPELGNCYKFITSSICIFRISRFEDLKTDIMRYM